MVTNGKFYKNLLIVDVDFTQKTISEGGYIEGDRYGNIYSHKKNVITITVKAEGKTFKLDCDFNEIVILEAHQVFAKQLKDFCKYNLENFYSFQNNNLVLEELVVDNYSDNAIYNKTWIEYPMWCYLDGVQEKIKSLIAEL